MKTYTHPQETWDEKKCERIAKHRGRDGYGSLHPYRGLVASNSSPYPGYGQTMKYNGGTTVNGEWYQAESVPLPKIPDTYEFYTISTWGTYIRRKEAK